MNLAESFPQSVRNMDHYSLSISRDINLATKRAQKGHHHNHLLNICIKMHVEAPLRGIINVKILQVTLKVLVCILQVKQCLDGQVLKVRKPLWAQPRRLENRLCHKDEAQIT